MTNHLECPPNSQAEQHEQCAKRSEGTINASAKDPESVTGLNRAFLLIFCTGGFFIIQFLYGNGIKTKIKRNNPKSC